jgi:hypothetical protein
LDDLGVFPGDTARRVTGIVRKFPSVSVFDLGEILKQVRSVVDQAAFAVQSVFVFTLFAGLVVLLAAVQATRDERRYEGAMLRTLGAPRAVVTRGIVTEFAVLGTLAGALAAAGASFAGWWLAARLLEVRYDPDPRVWLVGYRRRRRVGGDQRLARYARCVASAAGGDVARAVSTQEYFDVFVDQGGHGERPAAGAAEVVLM